MRRRQLMATLPVACIAAPALAQSPAQSGTAKARELRFGYQRSGTLLIAKQQAAIEQRLQPLGVEVKWIEFSFGPPLIPIRTNQIPVSCGRSQGETGTS